MYMHASRSNTHEIENVCMHIYDCEHMYMFEQKGRGHE